MKTLTVTDETAAGKVLQQILLQFEAEYITVEELIEARIRAEIEKYEQDAGNYRNGLVLPNFIEQRLNKKSKPKVDVEKQLYIALEAFQKNGFLVLIEDEQVERLDQQFLVDESTAVSFIKLTPLVGG